MDCRVASLLAMRSERINSTTDPKPDRTRRPVGTGRHHRWQVPGISQGELAILAGACGLARGRSGADRRGASGLARVAAGRHRLRCVWLRRSGRSGECGIRGASQRADGVGLHQLATSLPHAPHDKRGTMVTCTRSNRVLTKGQTRSKRPCHTSCFATVRRNASKNQWPI